MADRLPPIAPFQIPDVIGQYQQNQQFAQQQRANAQREQLTQQEIQGRQATLSDAADERTRRSGIDQLLRESGGMLTPDVLQRMIAIDPQKAAAFKKMADDADAAAITADKAKVTWVDENIGRVHDDASYRFFLSRAEKLKLNVADAPAAYDPTWVQAHKDAAASLKEQYEREHPKDVDLAPGHVLVRPTSRDAAPPAPTPDVDRATWDPRADGSAKGDGFLGVLKRPDGKVSSEMSIGVPINGKETEIPTLVPTLTPTEVRTLLTLDVERDTIPPAIVAKATAYARQRLAQGQSPFAGPGEQQADLYPQFTRVAAPTMSAPPTAAPSGATGTIVARNPPLPVKRTEAEQELDAYAKAIGKTDASALTYADRQMFEQNKAKVRADAAFQQHVKERQFDNANPAPEKAANQDKLEQEGRTLLVRGLSSRSGGLGLEDAKVQQANHLLALIDASWDPKTGEYNIPKVMQGELALGLARLVSPGGQVGLGLMKELNQATAKGDLNAALTYITGQPFNGTTQAVVQMFKDSIERQGQVALQNREGEMRYLRGLMPTNLEESRRQKLEATTLNPLRQSRIIQNQHTGERRMQVSVDGGATWQWPGAAPAPPPPVVTPAAPPVKKNEMSRSEAPALPVVQRNAFGQTLPLAPDQDYLGLAMDTLRGLTVGTSDPNDSQVAKAATVLAAAVPFLGGTKALKAAVSAEIAARDAGAVKGIRAYHGSPHDFEKFEFSPRTSMTGEGAQAYGHGAYLAEAEKVAQGYRDDLGIVVPSFGGRPVTTSAESMAHDILSRIPKSVAGPDATMRRAIQTVDEWADAGVFRGPNEGKAALDVKRAIAENFDKPLGKTVQGHMYEVNINAHPEDLLDWDKPLSQQKDLIAKLTPESLGLTFKKLDNGHMAFVNAENRPIGNFQKGGSEASFRKNWMESLFREDLTGRDLYQRMGNPVESTAALKQAGVPGIKYLDQGSRAAGVGTRNFVIFDDALIDVLKKYGIAGAVAATLKREFHLAQGRARSVGEQ